MAGCRHVRGVDERFPQTAVHRRRRLRLLRHLPAEYHGSDFASQTFATDDTRYEYTVVGDDDLSIRTMRAEGGRRGGVIGPRDDHVVFLADAGPARDALHRPNPRVEPGSPYIASASEAYRFESTGTVYNGVHIADRFLREVGRDLGFRLPDGPLLFDQQDEAIARQEPLRHLVRSSPRCSSTTVSSARCAPP